MSSSERKKTKKQNLPPTPQSKLNPSVPSLPDDLLMSCVARVSRLYYPTLSLVSKSFRSLIASPELYKARSLLGKTESCLYVCFKYFSDCRWFTLCRKPDQTLTNDNTSNNKKKKSSGYVLAKLPTLYSSHVNVSGLVAVGSDIYCIGMGARRWDNHKPSSRVMFLDCRSHTWQEAPSLRVKLLRLSASVVDGKIYVTGLHDCSVKNSCEVLDPKTLIWDHVPVPCSEKTPFRASSVCIDGKLQVETMRGNVCYNSKEGRWDVAGQKMYTDSFCVIENVVYTVSSYGDFKWYDTEVSKWKTLNGLVGLPEIRTGRSVATLADYGGKMMVLWREDIHYGMVEMIWCAEVTLKRSKSNEIWGEVESIDHVLTVPKGYEFLKALTPTV